jgi:RimJ/RimL family protein N-acetyltransferase
MIPGKKVRLRAYREDDVKNGFAMVNNQAVTRYLQFMRPRSLHEEREWIQAMMRNDNPNVVSLVVESSDNEYLGGVGLMKIDQRNRSAELGISIARPDDWGKGYGTEAAILMLRHAFEELNLHRVYLRVYDYNQRGQKSYAKIGFVEEGRLRQAHFRHGAWHDVVMMGILAEEFFARHDKTDDGKVPDALPSSDVAR